MSGKRKGRTRLRYNKRRCARRAQEPVFGKYTVDRIKDKIIEVKTKGKIYIGKVIKMYTGIISPNYKYSALELELPKTNETFYFMVAPNIDMYNGLLGKEFIIDRKGNERFPHVKIVRVLPLEEAILFKIEHNM